MAGARIATYATYSAITLALPAEGFAARDELGTVKIVWTSVRSRSPSGSSSRRGRVAGLRSIPDKSPTEIVVHKYVEVVASLRGRRCRVAATWADEL